MGTATDCCTWARPRTVVQGHGHGLLYRVTATDCCTGHRGMDCCTGARTAVQGHGLLYREQGHGLLYRGTGARTAVQGTGARPLTGDGVAGLCCHSHCQSPIAIANTHCQVGIFHLGISRRLRSSVLILP
ncbi:hypothetical protein ACOMHN_014355 [Nucella lapillus]